MRCAIMNLNLRKYKIYFTLLLAVVSLSAFSQEKPAKPIIQYIDIDSENQEVNIYWEASATPDIDNYEIYTLDITAYPHIGTELVTTVCGCSLSCTLPLRPEFPEIYTVVAEKDEKFSDLGGDYHKPVSLEVSYDSCNSSMLLDWSTYIGWKNNFSGFRVNQIDGEGIKTQLQVLDTSKLSYFHNNIIENSQYHYSIEAFDNRGRKSNSNEADYFTYMSPPPSFVNLDHISVIDDQTIEISFSADLNGEIDDFMILKSGSPNGTFSPWTTLQDIDSQTNIQYDNIATKAEYYYYRIDALNGCGFPVSNSNIGTNILLQGSSEDAVIQLNWNKYLDFGEGVSAYNIYRKNEYNEYELVNTISSSMHSYSEDISYIGEYNMKGEFTYYVEAIENGSNPIGLTGISKSNELKVYIETHLSMPNAFTPNIDGQNDIFMPVYDFTPKDFRMYIYDRAGKMIFFSSEASEGWDGSSGNASLAPEGVYVYHVEYLSYNGRRQIKTGNVTLISR